MGSGNSAAQFGNESHKKDSSFSLDGKISNDSIRRLRHKNLHRQRLDD